jgi:hypothetical protein
MPRIQRAACTGQRAPTVFDHEQGIFLCCHLEEFRFTYQIGQQNEFYTLMTRCYLEEFGWAEATDGNETE